MRVFCGTENVRIDVSRYFSGREKKLVVCYQCVTKNDQPFICLCILVDNVM